MQNVTRPVSAALFSLALLFSQPALAGPPSIEEGETLLASGKTEEAIKIFLEVAKKEERGSEETKSRAALGLAHAYRLEVLRSAGRDAETKLSLQKKEREAYEAYLKLRPDDGDVLLEFSQLLLEAGSEDAAEDTLSRALYNGKAKAARVIGELRFKHQDYQGAAEAYQIAAKLGYPDPKLFLNLGLCQVKLGDPEGAKSSLESAVAAGLSDIAALSEAGHALLDLDDKEAAIEAFRRNVEKHGNAATYSELALALADDDQPGEALYYYKRAIEEASKQSQPAPLASIKNNYAWFLCTSKNPDYQRVEYLKEAEAMAKDAIKLSERKKKEYLDTLAEVEFRLGRPALALPLAKEALALAPEETYYQSQVERFTRAVRRPITPGEVVRLGE